MGPEAAPVEGYSPRHWRWWLRVRRHWLRVRHHPGNDGRCRCRWMEAWNMDFRENGREARAKRTTIGRQHATSRADELRDHVRGHFILVCSLKTRRVSIAKKYQHRPESPVTHGGQTVQIQS